MMIKISITTGYGTPINTTYVDHTELRGRASNPACLRLLDLSTITGIHAIEQTNGLIKINQVSGYSRNTGIYCYGATADGNLTSYI